MRGRPRKPDNEKRGKLVCVRLSPDELQSLEQAAETQQVSMSEYIRTQAVTGATAEAIREAMIDRLIVELRRVGTKHNDAEALDAVVDILSRRSNTGG